MPAVLGKCVPMASPEASFKITSVSRPSVMTTCTPEAVASWAASILVIMPPVPILLAVFAPSRLMLASILVTSGISRASESREGSAVYRPPVSVSIMSISASIRLATIADRLSLSPNLASLISSVEITSFSFTIQITRSSISASSVLRALR